MKRGEPVRLRVGVIGAGALCEHLLLPALSGPDILAAPDDGAWWLRRPTPNVDIAFAPPFRVEVVALCDADPARLKRVGEAARVPLLYTDWKRLLAEHATPALTPAAGALDAIFLALPPARSDEILVALSSRRLHQATAWLWLAGPPALSSRRASELSSLHSHRAVWCARPLSRALAHRAARRMLDRGEIGVVRALSLRWHTPLPLASDSAQNRLAEGEFGGQVAALASALDVLLEFAAPEAALEEEPQLERLVLRAQAHERAGASVALIEFANGVGASLLLSSGDEWNSPLPRLEIVGTQGRFLVCKGGRELRLYAPREATRSWNAPSLAPSISGAEASGVAEDVRLFLHSLLQERASTRSTTDSLRDEARRDRRAHSLGRAALVLRLWEELASAARSPAASSGDEPLEAGASQPPAPLMSPHQDASASSQSNEPGARSRGSVRRAVVDGTLQLPFETDE